jgi:hypothetical protein
MIVNLKELFLILYYPHPSYKIEESEFSSLKEEEYELTFYRGCSL